jgi:hypothetical protein
MSRDCGCIDCKRIREHVALLLPFKIYESAADKPLRISGVAMAAGISRNFNIYTPKELEAFAEKLVGAPLYMEHVTANAAVGKYTKSIMTRLLSRCSMRMRFSILQLPKIRYGLIQHLIVGADYSAIDVVDEKFRMDSIIKRLEPQ